MNDDELISQIVKGQATVIPAGVLRESFRKWGRSDELIEEYLLRHVVVQGTDRAS